MRFKTIHGPAFLWNSVSMHLDEGIKCLNMTTSGQQGIANLHHQYSMCRAGPAPHGTSGLAALEVRSAIVEADESTGLSRLKAAIGMDANCAAAERVLA